MTIRAKYAGKCRKCGGTINVGDTIEWERGRGAAHSPECPPEMAVPTEEDAPFQLYGGSGYGCQGWTRGQVLRNSTRRIEQGEPEFLFVLWARKDYVGEDGMSFGVGDESGYTYQAKCREATNEEAAPIKEQIAEREAIHQAYLKVNATIEQFIKEGESPEGDHILDGERVDIGQGQNIYGGGAWFVIADDFIWYVRNNGADGDCWAHNNVRTGGAGAIGWRLPYKKGLADYIRMNCERGKSML